MTDYCPRCIEDWTDDSGVDQKRTKEASECQECGICDDCEHMAECSESDNEHEVCGNCSRIVPFGYLQPLQTTDGVTADICAVCALRVTNLALGIQREQFQGMLAEELRQSTLLHYKKTKQEHNYGN